jgi:hypothetical protein
MKNCEGVHGVVIAYITLGVLPPFSSHCKCYSLPNTFDYFMKLGALKYSQLSVFLD